MSAGQDAGLDVPQHHLIGVQPLAIVGYHALIVAETMVRALDVPGIRVQTPYWSDQ